MKHLNRCKTSSSDVTSGLFTTLFTNLGYHSIIMLQGGAEHSGDCTQRSYPLVLEAESDHFCVPAISTSVLSFSVMGRG